MHYVSNNGEIIAQQTPSIYAGNRGFLYGDGVFESIRLINGKPINLKNHLARLTEGIKALKIKMPPGFTLEFLEQHIIELAFKSGIAGGGRCRVSIDRMIGGSYKPISNEGVYFIEVYPLENNLFEMNSKGIEVDIFMDIKKFKSPLSNFKTKNGLIYVMAALKGEELGLGDMLLTNERGGILESSNSNLFIVSNGVLYTPGLEEGCLAGTMRMQVINLAIENGIKVYECNVLPQNLLVADEIFLTNAIQGIQWVSGYRTKRYFNTTGKRILNLLNEKFSS